MIKSIENRINELRYQTYDNIKSIELAHVPYAYYLKYENLGKYTMDGKIYDFTEQLRDINNSTHIFLAHNLPFTFQTRNHNTYKSLVRNLIETGEMIPFLLFANGKLIKWSDIEIVRDYRYSYVIINNTEYDIEEDSLVCVLTPLNVEYTEGATVDIISSNSLYFDIDGKYTIFKDEVYTSVKFSDRNTSFRNISGNSGFRFKIKYEDSNNLEDPDILVYKLDDILTTDLSSIVSRIVVYNEDGTSYEVGVELANNFQINTKEYGQLGFIENCLVFKDGLLKVDLRDQLERGELNFISSEDTSIDVKIFKYDCSQVSNDLIFKIPNTLYTKYLIEEDSEVLDPIKNKNFNFKFEKSKSYEYNLNKAFEYIANYDFNLFNDIIKSQSKIVSFSYTGEKIKSLVKDNYFNIPKLLDPISLNTSSCIIFVNGLIYKYYKMSDDTPMYFKMYVPEGSINDSDKIEIVHFRNINNIVLELSLDKDNSIKLSNLDLNNCEIYVDGIEDQLYELDNKYFKTKVDFTFTKNNDLYHIDIDEKYYNKNIKLVSSNRFAYLHYHIPDDCLGVELNLRNDFLYCRNKNQYMIFINGKLIEPEYYELKIPEQDSPVNDMAMYFYLPLYKGTTVSIFYVPREFTRITQDTIDEEGYISVDINTLNYPLDKDGFLYFINGKKVFTDDILNINKNTIKLNVDMKSVNNLTILKHIDEVSDLSAVFLNNTLWDNFLSSLEDEERKKLFNISTVIQTNTDTNIYEETITKEQLLYELVAQYYLENGLSNGEDFLYTLDDDIISDEDVDSEGTNIIRLVDVNNKEKANIYGIEEE